MFLTFPLTQQDGSAGFGVGRTVSQTSKGRWTAHWYSNPSESLLGPFLPCYVRPSGDWYYGEKQEKDDKPLMTADYYPGEISRRTVADAGFNLTDEGYLPKLVLERTSQHPAYEWTLDKN